ncbi:Inner membrane component of tripartite multidrug resistance system [Minicystis rosea]|nr:Inner membrane component of tripartite multidrug resistance system [Minicystis rosea]
MATAAVADAPVESAEAESQGAKNKWFIAVAVALGALLEVVDTSIVNVALQQMQASLGATLTQVSWVVSSYAVANVIILPLTAWLGDRFGKKRYFIFSLVAFTIASMLCGMATNLPMLVFARVLQGLGGGGLLAKAQAILFETFPKKEQPMAQGFFGAIVIAGPAIGPTLGGYIVTNIDWRWIFYINLPVGIAAVLMCMSFLPDDKEERDTGSVDWLAIALLAIGLGSLQTVLEEGQSEDWFESRFIVTFSISAVVCLTLFIYRQLVSPRPVVDLRVLRHRSLWAGSILSVIVGMALYGGLFAVPIFAQSILKYTSQQTGMLLLPGALASAFAMPIAAKLVAKYDPRKLLVIGALILFSSIMMLTRLSPLTSGGDLTTPLMVRSFGTVLMFLPLNMATLGPIPKHEVGKAAGFFSLTRQLGGSVGVALLTALLDRRMAFHHAVLAEKLDALAPHTLERVNLLTQAMMAKGSTFDEARARALALLDGSVSLQGMVMSFGDTFWATGALVIGTLPLVLLLGKSAGKVQMDH